MQFELEYIGFIVIIIRDVHEGGCCDCNCLESRKRMSLTELDVFSATLLTSLIQPKKLFCF